LSTPRSPGRRAAKGLLHGVDPPSFVSILFFYELPKFDDFCVLLYSRELLF
jgi:hypothetical protein